MRKLMFSKLLSSVMVIAGFALFIFVGKHVFATPNATGGADNQTRDKASRPSISAVSLEKSVVFQHEGEPEDGAFWDMGEPSAKIAAGANANAVLSLDLIANGGSGNQRDDGVTTGTVSGQGTTIAVEVFATGVTTSLRGVILKFEFDASLLSYVKAENTAFPLAIPDESVGTNLAAMALVTLAPSGFLARAEFETVVDVTGREFSIGIESVTLAENSASQDELTTASAITFNATPSADFDGDGIVGFSDFLAFAGSFGTSQADSRYEARFDLDGSGSVDFSDFLIFAGAFGSRVSPSDAGETVNIADANLRAVIADSLGKADNAPITRAEMATLTDIAAPNKGVRNLTGLEYATNLQRLGLGRARMDGSFVNSNVISNLSPLSNLINLTYLSLTSNRISDISALSNLINLTDLHLGGNVTISDISALTNLSSLTRVNLWGNSISDISALASLSKLKHLHLHGNELRGTIPVALGNLENLEWLSLSRNELRGTIPEELGNLSNLTHLYLRGNELSGAIPVELGSLSNLTHLYLYGNELSGGIPEELGNLSNLTHLYLHENQLSGGIPVELGNLSNLTRLYLHWNELSGAIPVALGSLSNLTFLSLHGNELDGAIPVELGNLENLEWLSLFGNQLSGAIPVALGSLSNLTFLSLHGNELDGAIPVELGNLENLEWLSLFGNQLSGAIPVALGSLSNLTHLSLGGNELSGAIPVELGNLSNLTHLYLYENQLSGAIPEELGNLSNLTHLSLFGNQLSGAIPEELGNLESLEVLSLFGNQLSGAIPEELGNLESLEWLNLHGNQLSGTIPVELGNLSNLTFLDLQENQLSGAIPQNMTGLTKLETFRFQGNGGLCAPLNAAFQTWLQGIKDASGPNCSGTSPPSDSPDLIVESPSVNDNTLTTGQSFTLRATVRNQGNAAAAATTLRYYRSSNATISADDVEVGTDGVSSLSAGGTSAESISLNAPSGAGTYYYGACVDNVSGESNTGNNCSSGVSVTVSGGGGGGERACTAGLVVKPDESCNYKNGTFYVNSSGLGIIISGGLVMTSGNSHNQRGIINGVRWNFRATKNSGSNSWTIHVAN